MLKTMSGLTFCSGSAWSFRVTNTIDAIGIGFVALILVGPLAVLGNSIISQGDIGSRHRARN